MNFLKIISVLITFILFQNGFSQQQEQAISGITDAIKNTSSKKLATFFESTIDLEVNDTDGSFSKKQAEVIVSDFFEKNPVQSFTVKHKGSSNDGSKYIIGSYISKSKIEFRVYVLLKKSDAGLMINQLQFEKD